MIMNSWNLVLRNLLFYRWKNLTVALGISISTAVLTGALIVGDSVSHNLNRLVDLRLGEVNIVLSTAERFVTSNLAPLLQKELHAIVSPVLVSEGMAVAEEGGMRANNIQVLGIGESFDKVLGINPFYNELSDEEAIISRNMAERLNLKAGDEFLLRIKKASLIPLNAPFVSDEEIIVSTRLKIKAIAGDMHIGRFNLRISQTSPLNVFISIDHLNRLMKLNNKANLLLFSSTPSIKADEIYSAVQRSWSAEDIGLVFREIPSGNQFEITSERIFIDNPVSKAIQTFQISGEFILTYFVNSITAITSNSTADQVIPDTPVSGNNNLSHLKSSPAIRMTPYSFVSTMPDNILSEQEIIVNEWLADDLNLKKGDSVAMRFFIVGPLRRLAESQETFIVKEVVPIKGQFADKSLMPDIPGLSDAGNCSDWETGIPIDLGRIRDKDEKYWTDFKGTPKAFISISLAKELWENMYGAYTAVRFPLDKAVIEAIDQHLKTNINPVSLGFLVTDVKDESYRAANQGVDFSQLFLGLSFFVMLAALILSVLLMILNLEGRRSQLLTLAAMGIPQKTIRRLILTEGLLVTLSGAIIGSVLAIFYTGGIFSALNGIWSDIVRTDMMQMVVKIPVLLTGFLISVFISWITVIFTVRSFLKSEPVKSIKLSEKSSGRAGFYAALVMAVISIGLILIQILSNETVNAGTFFIAGGGLLISVLLFLYYFMNYFSRQSFGSINIFKLGLRNILRNKNRSISIISLLAIGTFIVLSTGTNRKDVFIDAKDKTSGTGGYLFFSETTVPVNRDLNNMDVRQEFGITEDIKFVQFSKAPGDDASCLNLNRISKPVILGVDPGEMEGRFSFVSRTPFLSMENPWYSLRNPLSEGLVPAFADQTVIKWGLGMKVGDTLSYTNALGREFKLLLIGGLANSIFQGNVIIADEYFRKHFPDHIGSSVFLIDVYSENIERTESQLNMIFRDYGWEMTTNSRRLAEFNSVENTYLSIFLMMGARAVLIGTIGVSIILARSIMERKKEITLLGAFGIGRQNILRLFINEFLLLLLAGSFAGILTSTIATLPSLLSLNTGVSFSTVLFFFTVLLLNGIFWIWFMAWFFLKDKNVALSLQND